MKYALPKWLMLVCYAWILCVLGLCIAVSLEFSAWRRLGLGQLHREVQELLPLIASHERTGGVFVWQ
jgi:hypothetical protein